MGDTIDRTGWTEKDHAAERSLNATEVAINARMATRFPSTAAARQAHYILSADHQPLAVGLGTWGVWFEKNQAARIVQQEDVGEFWVSTVFLGLDHSFGELGPPILFETMVFPRQGRRGHDLYCDRYPTWEMALLGHRSVVAALRAGTLFEPRPPE